MFPFPSLCVISPLSQNTLSNVSPLEHDVPYHRVRTRTYSRIRLLFYYDIYIMIRRQKKNKIIIHLFLFIILLSILWDNNLPDLMFNILMGVLIGLHECFVPFPFCDSEAYRFP